MSKRLPKCFLAAYDFGNDVADRYYVIFGSNYIYEGYARGMSDNAMQPNGVNIYSRDIDNVDYEIRTMNNLAKRMRYSKLPNQVQRAIELECELFPNVNPDLNPPEEVEPEYFDDDLYPFIDEEDDK